MKEKYIVEKIDDYSWAIPFPKESINKGEYIGELQAKKLKDGCFQIEILAIRHDYRRKGLARNLVQSLISEIDLEENDLQVSPAPFDYYSEGKGTPDMNVLCDIYLKLGFIPIPTTFVPGKIRHMIYVGKK